MSIAFGGVAGIPMTEIGVYRLSFFFWSRASIVFKCPIPSHCRAIYELMWTHAGDMNSPTEKRTSVHAVGRLDQSLV